MIIHGYSEEELKKLPEYFDAVFKQYVRNFPNIV